MKYTFNNNNLITGYIKNLLHEFNLPQAKVITESTKLYDGKYYIDKRKLLYGKNKKQIGTYTFGEKIPNITKNLVINSSIYDSYTHNYLGDYLRFLRDYTGLNLMPLYNCFSNEIPYDLRFSLALSEEEYLTVNTEDTRYKYFIVPIKFDTTYNIAIDSQLPYEICAMIYTGSQILKLSKQLMRETFRRVNNSRFSEPFIFKVDGSDTIQEDSDNLKYSDYEENLRLLIRMPKSVESSIVIIEGDISGCKSLSNSLPTKVIYNEEQTIVSDDKTNKLDVDYSNYPVNTALSLLSVNDGNSYPFADRLVEYLLRNVIDCNEMIKYNVGRVQNKLYTMYKFKGHFDIWNMDINFKIHDFIGKPLKVNSAIIDLSTEEKSSANDVIESYKSLTDDGDILVDYSKLSLKDTVKDLLSYVDKDVEYYLEAE